MRKVEARRFRKMRKAEEEQIFSLSEPSASGIDQFYFSNAIEASKRARA